jgi:WhiB family transcriptional regulator, redox-sensing transcriptional regulator
MQEIDVHNHSGTTLDWRELAVCKGQVKRFFGPPAERPQARARREAAARLICADCPVIVECRTWAREHHESGFWGGESEETRYLQGFQISAPIGACVRLRRLGIRALDELTSPTR